MGLVKCWILISSLSTTNYMPTNFEQRLEVCSYILHSVPVGKDPHIALAIGWQESGYTDAKGKWICTRRGMLVRENLKPKCIPTSRTKGKSRLTRAIGPMQILPIYHCKGQQDCDTLRDKTTTGVKLLYRLIEKHGEKDGIAIYAGGTINPKSIRYMRMTLHQAKRIRLVLEDSTLISITYSILGVKLWKF